MIGGGRTASDIEPARLVGELNGLYLYAGGIVPRDLPALGAHVPRAQDRHCAVALAQDHAVVAAEARDGAVDDDAQLRGRVVDRTDVVAPLGGLADAVETVNF